MSTRKWVVSGLRIIQAVAVCVSLPISASIQAASSDYVNPGHGNPAQELMRLRAEGVAHYESGIAQKKALASFQSAIATTGSGAIDHFNLAVILKKLNRIADAKKSINAAIKADKNLAHPHYLLGLILLAEENNQAALKAFQNTALLAPAESSAHYQLSRIYRELDNKGAALQSIIETLRLDRYHTGALYQLYLHHQQAGDKEKSQQIFVEFSRLKKAFGKTRLEINPDESILAKPINGASAFERLPFGPVASPPKLLIDRLPLGGDVIDFAVADINQDNIEDIVTAGSGGRLSLWLAKDPGKFVLGDSVSGLGDIQEISLAKFTRNGLYSTLVRSASGLKMVSTLDQNPSPKDPKAKHHNANSHPPKKISVKFGTVSNVLKEKIHSYIIADIDHDGDSDIAVNGFSKVLINRATGAFDMRDDYFDKTLSVGGLLSDVVGGDFRDQTTVDFIAVTKDNKRRLLRDDMGGKYSIVSDGLSPIADLKWHAIADMDNDGRLDIVNLAGHGMVIDYNAGEMTFKSLTTASRIPSVAAGRIVDINNDGFKDLVFGTQSGAVKVFVNAGEKKFGIHEIIHVPDGVEALEIIDINSDGIADIAGLDKKKKMFVLTNASDTRNANWITINLEGIRSAPDGRYTRVEVRYGNFYSKYQFDGGLVTIPIGQASHAELLRITWPNGFVENKFNIQPANTWYFAESERISGSCPSVYAWNGSRYVYITDAFISGPMGVPTGPDSYFPVGDDEYVRIPGEHMQVDESGFYRVSIVEELKEVTYLDQVKLIAVDYPADYKMFPNEYLMPPDFPDFRLHLSAGGKPPVAAVDHRGTDVSEWLKAVDYTYPHDFNRSAYTGFADTNSIEFSLTEAQRRSETLRIFLTGWFYYFDSTSLVAAFQNPEVELIWPQIQAYREGEWKFVSKLGIPSGKEKTVMLDLSGQLHEDVEKIRVITNLEMYWDRILIDAEPEPAASQAVLTPLDRVSSRLRFHGFSQLIRPEGAFPMPDRFDYHQTGFKSMWDPLAGLYTRYGDVDALVSDIDSMMAVFGSGDEIAMRFDSRQLPTLEPGYQRDFLIYLNGFVKDGDKYTAHAGTVEPMPFKGLKNYPFSSDERSAAHIDERQYQEYINRYQTRKSLRFVGATRTNDENKE